jgi:hypothetical protein
MTGGFCATPGAPASSIIGSDSRAYIQWADRPEIEPLIGTCTVNIADIVGPTTVSITLFGASASTYLVEGSFPRGSLNGGNNFLSYCCAILWE